MKYPVAALLLLAAITTHAQSVDWHKSFQTEHPINPYNNPSIVRMAEEGYWMAFVADHHTAYNISHGDVRITRCDAGGAITAEHLIGGNVAVVGMEAMGEYLYMRLSAFEEIRLNDSLYTFPSRQHVLCRMDEAGMIEHLPFFGDSISAWTVNHRGEHVFTTDSGFGGNIVLYEVDPQGHVVRSKHLDGLGYVFTISEKTNGDGYVIGGGCMGTVDVDSVYLEPVDDYTNYVLSLDGDLTARWMRAIEDISCVVNQVWSDGAITYYAGQTAVAPTFDNLAYAGPGGMGYDFFLSRLDGEAFSWVRETPGDTGWTGAMISHHQGMAVDDAGNIYLLGHQRGDPVEWAPGFVTGIRENSEEAFILSYDASGHFRWAKGIAGRGLDYGMSIAARGVDDILVSVTHSDTISIDGQAIPGVFGTTSLIKIAAETTAVDRPVSAERLPVHPNPVRELAYIQLPVFRETIIVELFDATGRLITRRIETPDTRTMTLDLTQQAPGTYFVRASAGLRQAWATVVRVP
jgi:hypothetical protein